jgi:hypothetical protein
MTHVRMDKLKPQRLKLGQALSKEVLDGKCRPGEFINNTTLQNFGSSLEFIPFLQTFSRAIWIPINDGGGRECTSRDGFTGDKYGDCLKCGKSELWTKNDITGATVPPPCSDQDNFAVMVRGCDAGPMVISFSKSGSVAGKKLSNILVPLMHSGKDIWSRAFKLTCLPKTYGKFTCFVPQIEMADVMPTEEEKALAEMYYNQYAPKTAEMTDFAMEQDQEAEMGAPVDVTAKPEKGASKRI